MFDRAVDHFEHLESGPSRFAEQRNLVVAEVPEAGAEEQPAGHDRFLWHDRFQGQAIQDGLEDPSAIDHGLATLGAIAAGLVVGHPQQPGLPMALDQVDGAAQEEPVIHERGVRRAVFVAVQCVGEAEGKFEALGRPLGALFDQQLEPVLQVAANRRDLVGPDPVDRRNQVIAFLPADLRNGFIESLPRFGQRGFGQREQAGGLQLLQRRRLELVDQAAAGERVQLLQRRRRFERRQPIHRGHQELVGTRGKTLQRGQ